jgi:hypothetical protein
MGEPNKTAEPAELVGGMELQLFIENSLDVFKTAPQVLQTNNARTAKAVLIGTNLLNAWELAWKIPDEDTRLTALAELDAKSNNFLVKAATALAEETALRSGITQIMDQFKKLFINAEEPLDKKKAGTLAANVHLQRNNYLLEYNRIEKKRADEIEKKAKIAKEEIDTRAAVELQIFDWYSKLLLKKKQQWMNSFNGITLADYDDKATKLKALQPVLTVKPDEVFKPVVYSSLLSKQRIEEITNEVIAEKWAEYEPNYIAEMTLLKDDLIDKLPGKKNELDEIERVRLENERLKAVAAEAERKRQAEINAAKDAKEKQRLKDLADAEKKKEQARLFEEQERQQRLLFEQQQREEQEAARLLQEQEDLKNKNSADVEAKKQGATTMAMFEAESELVQTVDAPNQRQGFEITVLHPAGYLQIISFYFEREGKNQTVEKLAGMKLESMKTFCEKHAHKTGEKIDNKFIK